MSTYFVDTSALFATIDDGDDNHERAVAVWRDHVADDDRLVTSSFVVAEAMDLVRRRLGLSALRVLDEIIGAEIDIVWVGAETYGQAKVVLYANARRHLSLVDCVSFVVARSESVDAVFAYDADFEREAFRLLGS